EARAGLWSAVQSTRLTEDVEERQRPQDYVVLAHLYQRRSHRGALGDVPVREHRALGSTRGSRRVEDHGGIVAVAACHAVIRLGPAKHLFELPRLHRDHLDTVLA